MDIAGQPKHPPKLTLPTKLAYGAGDFGAGLTSNLLAFSFLIFLTNVAGLEPLAAGTVLLIGKIWDAVNDPLVGILSDRTRTRWGRRYPWIALTGIPFGITFLLNWIVPGFTSQIALFWYYVVVSIAFQIFFTTTNLPYSTLTAEMTEDYDERTELTSFRLAFSLGGAVLILALGLVVSQLVSDPGRQYQVLGALGGGISIFTIYWCIFGTFRHSQQQAAYRSATTNESQTNNQESFFQQLKIVFSNRPFLFVVGIYLFSWLALQITATIIPFYVTFWMGADDYFLAALLVQGTAIIMMFVCNVLAKRIGKKGLYFLGSGFWILVQIALFFLQPGQLNALYLLCIFASFGVATAYVVPWSILPDVIELNELQTGQRSEGAFYAFMTLLQKMGLAAGIFLVSLALETSGFAKDAIEQPESALLAIRFFMGPVPLILLIGGMILAYFYPITKATHQETLLKLAERRKQTQ
ncbi:MFS transporter [Leptothoe kymatousa]|uniref:MFS transporter n=1 Tax=Leptothoe kymatousa TAU-MAC 1615 TaxID=2364775 RepID=A0ABS5Y1L0_9CYAN|nr:MFS transporter [Leptothoe kymatousa]MBT9311708.1 MFS transporter [Leptothoe kymatousa TAU-MAC 1615]